MRPAAVVPLLIVTPLAYGSVAKRNAYYWPLLVALWMIVYIGRFVFMSLIVSFFYVWFFQVLLAANYF